MTSLFISKKERRRPGVPRASASHTRSATSRQSNVSPYSATIQSIGNREGFVRFPVGVAPPYTLAFGLGSTHRECCTPLAAVASQNTYFRLVLASLELKRVY